MVELAVEYGRYGYRRVAALLRSEGFAVNHKCIERLWRREGLKVPQKQPKRGRLWLNDGSCVRLRPERKDHVWSYDFVHARTRDGRAFRMLNIIDEYTWEWLVLKRPVTIPEEFLREMGRINEELTDARWMEDPNFVAGAAPEERAYSCSTAILHWNADVDRLSYILPIMASSAARLRALCPGMEDGPTP
jgi:hypothetical protein